MLMDIPHGYAEIMETFGDPSAENFIRNMVVFKLPYKLLFRGHPITTAYGHRKAVGNFQAALENILSEHLDSQVQNYAGIYAERAKRGMRGYLSVHTWGIAIDLEAEKFPLGSLERFSPEVVSCFSKAGFVYGGDFEGRKDPMHFQLCSGY